MEMHVNFKHGVAFQHLDPGIAKQHLLVHSKPSDEYSVLESHRGKRLGQSKVCQLIKDVELRVFCL